MATIRPGQSFFTSGDDYSYANNDYSTPTPGPPPPPKERTGGHKMAASQKIAGNVAPYEHNVASYRPSKESYNDNGYQQQDVDFYSATPVKNPQSPTTRIIAKLSQAIRWFVVTASIAMLLAIPMILYRDDKDRQTDVVIEKSEDPDIPPEATTFFKENATTARIWNNFYFCKTHYELPWKLLSYYVILDIYLSAWLVCSWLSACFGHLFSFVLPYLFRWIAKYVNPAHGRYWKVFRRLKWPFTFLFGAVGSLAGFIGLLELNPTVTLTQVGDDQGANLAPTAATLEIIITTICLWVFMYFIEKIMILYICIHYHSRSFHGKLERSKEMQKALISLYETSIYHYPIFDRFSAEDSIIHGFDRKGAQQNGSKPFQKMAVFGRKIPHAFGHIIGSESDSHFWRPDSHYATIERALEHPASAAALAKRIWVSLVAQGRTALTVDDIAEALGPHRREEAEEIFRTLDENRNGDIRLNEFVPSIVEAGRVRHAIYCGMSDIDHAINTFDWILIIWIFFGIVIYLLVGNVTSLKDLKELVGFVALGLSFTAGRIMYKFFIGAVFVMFEHPFDVGDRVELFNLPESLSVSATVSRISLLYVVFKRVDDGKDLQFPTDRLNLKRIENVSRSGQNRETISIFVDFGTSFKDIQLFRKELEMFLHRHENARDFEKGFSLTVKSFHEMNKLELKCAVTHKSNWSNESLREARSSRLQCAVIAAFKKVCINKPGGARPTLGDDARPNFTVMLSEEEAAKRIAAEKATNAAKKRAAFPIEEEMAAEEFLSPHTSAYPQQKKAVLEEIPVLSEEEQKEKDKKEADEKEAKDKRDEEQALVEFMEISHDIEDETRDRVFSAGDRLLSVGGQEASSFAFIGRNEMGVRRSNRSDVQLGNRFGNYGNGGMR